MRLIMFTGFLGSGKTSLLIDLAKYLSSLNKKIAFLVNEAGNVPLDGDWVENNGYKVKQISAGCICCQATSNMAEALKQIAADYDVDFVLIEPSGIANPENLSGAISQLNLGKVEQYCVLDCARLPLLLKAVKQLVYAGIEQADVVLLNKVDLVSEEKIQEIATWLSEECHKDVIQPVSGSQGLKGEVWKGVLNNE